MDAPQQCSYVLQQCLGWRTRKAKNAPKIDGGVQEAAGLTSPSWCLGYPIQL